MITQKELKELFEYDSETGFFVRLTSSSGAAKKGTIPKSINKDGYYQLRINYKMYTQHRLAWLYVNGEFPIGDIDHINHIRTDNRIINLRTVNKATNNKNLKKRKVNTSGFNGVWWHKNNKKWCAEITCNGEKTNLGSFIKIEDAIAARKKANIKYDFHENHGE